ncbi:MAG TPA: TonB family protein [Stellaceae bacterium]|nr:TonB family protein [Stellaceae bacterium]
MTDLPDTIDLAFDETKLPDDARIEPLVVAAPRRADLAEALRLDPTRLDLGPDPAPPRRSMWRGPTGSLILHLLPLLLFLASWLRTPIEIPPPIPVQLVMEQPPPPPPLAAPTPAPPKPKAEPKPPPGRLSSDNMGEVEPDKAAKGNDTAPPTSGEPQPPATAAQPAEAEPDPPPKDQANAEVPPATAQTQVAAIAPQPQPKPAPPKPQSVTPAPKPDGWVLPLSPSNKPHEARRLATVVGPNATRDEYCAYALQLTISHINLLPLSLVGARHGDTIVGIRVLEDGTITQVRVIQGSGYTDIDERVAQMVTAVGRLPPLPQWMPGPYEDFTFHLHFPNPAER